MGAYFIDIDGTILDFNTSKPLDGAVESINELYNMGNIIIITTYRGYNWDITSRFHPTNTERTLKSIGLKYHHILWDIPSPRVVVNDDGAYAIEHESDAPWSDEMKMHLEKFTRRRIRKPNDE